MRSSLRVVACNSPGQQRAKLARSRDGEILNFETGALLYGQSSSMFLSRRVLTWLFAADTQERDADDETRGLSRNSTHEYAAHKDDDDMG